VSQDLKEQMRESKSFRTREFNTILGRAGLEDCSVFFSSPCRKMQICPDQTWILGLWRKLSWILDNPWRCVQKHHKRGRACYQCGAVSPEALVFHLYQVGRQIGSVGLSFGSGALVLGRAGTGVLLLGRAFAGLVV